MHQYSDSVNCLANTGWTATPLLVVGAILLLWAGLATLLHSKSQSARLPTLLIAAMLVVGLGASGSFSAPTAAQASDSAHLIDCDDHASGGSQAPQIPTLTPVTPTISGLAQVGQVLTVAPGTWAPAPVALTYQWYAGGVTIPGATSSTYLVDAADVGLVITVQVTGSKTGYTSVSKTSSPTAAVTPAPDGLTFLFTPQLVTQYIWYCPDGNAASVCSGGYTRQMTNTSWNTNHGADDIERLNIPLATLTAENSGTGYFNVTVKAPQTLPPASKIGPGVGITCLNRNGGPLVGTANGRISPDWTGSGVIGSVQMFNYWYTGCSFDSGVTEAEFYGITGVI